uniref:ATP synthase F0 subunit 8 n=1 Tax=Panagrolaimus sp. PS1159 TaxID=55785 RepID=A0AC35FBS9_9BILA
MTPLTYWNWLAATWIFLVISISTIISFQCLKKGKSVKPAATTPQPASTASKPPSGNGTPAAPKPPAEAEAADGHYEDVTVG